MQTFDIMQPATELLNVALVKSVVDDAVPTSNNDLIQLATQKLIDKQNFRSSGEKSWSFILPPGKFVNFSGMLLSSPIEPNAFFELMQYILAHPNANKLEITNESGTPLPEIQTIFDSFTIPPEYFEEGMPFHGKYMRVELRAQLVIEDVPYVESVV